MRRAAALAVVVAFLGGCGSEGAAPVGLVPPPELPYALSPDLAFLGTRPQDPSYPQVAAASARLAVDLLAATDGNAVVSPLALQLGLGMLRDGASGEVVTEINKVTGLPRGSQAVADLRADLFRYSGYVGTELAEAPRVPKVDLIEGIFVQPGFLVRRTFLERAAAYHRADVYEVDFAADDGARLVDAWVQQQSGGLLDGSPVPLRRSTRVLEMSALAFAARWSQEFEPRDTRLLPFTRSDGTVVRVPTMQQVVAVPFAEGDGWVAVELACGDRYAMRIVLPEVGGVANWKSVHQALAGAPEQELLLALPKWQSATLLDVTPLLGDLGLSSLTEPEDGLDGLFHGAAVDGLANGAALAVTERGMVGVAGTEPASGGNLPAAELEVHLDHPFEYQLIDQQTNVVLLAGRMTDPAALES